MVRHKNNACCKFFSHFLFDCARLCPKVLHTWNNAEMVVFKHVVSVHLAAVVLASAHPYT